MKYWDDFYVEQSDILDDIDGILPSDDKIFETRHFLQGMGERVARHKVHDEASLMKVHDNVVGDPVKTLVSELSKHDSSMHDLMLPTTIEFQPMEPSNKEANGSKPCTTEMCTYRFGTGQREVAYVIEYKAPHKLPTSYFDYGLRPTNISKDVANKPILPEGPDPGPGKLQRYARYLMSVAVTETYSHMIDAGLEYGYLTNGEAIAFIYVDWAEPTVVHCHRTIPSRELRALNDACWSSALCQVFAFTALALQSRQWGSSQRAEAAETCNKWAIGFDHAVSQVAAAEASVTPTYGRGRYRRLPVNPEWQRDAM